MGAFREVAEAEGADPIILTKFYQAVFQAVQLFEGGTWVLLSEMLKKIEGVLMGFLQQVTWMKA